MVVDAAEIQALREQPETADANPAQNPRPDTGDLLDPLPPELRRILRIKVPVIVKLAGRRMPLGAIRRLALGNILEFEQMVDQPLELLVNNRPIGTGTAVKVGDRFGLQITTIRTRAQRVRTLAAEPT